MKNCRYCKQPHDMLAETCPHCLSQVGSPEEAAMVAMGWFVIIVVFVVMFMTS